MEFFFQRLADDATFFLFQKRTTSLLSTSIRVLIKYFYMKWKKKNNGSTQRNVIKNDSKIEGAAESCFPRVLRVEGVEKVETLNKSALFTVFLFPSKRE